MFNAKLFLGFPVDRLFSQELEKIPRPLLERFIGERGEYLVEVQHEGLRFLGKPCPAQVSLQELEQLELNIYSLLKKLVQVVPYNEAPLYLFPLLEPMN